MAVYAWIIPALMTVWLTLSNSTIRNELEAKALIANAIRAVAWAVLALTCALVAKR